MSKTAHEGGTWEDGLYQDDQGWWFRDEAEDLNGPYLTKDEASKQSKAYVNWLTGASDA